MLSGKMKNEIYWRTALDRSLKAIKTKSLIPLETTLEIISGEAEDCFELRHLMGGTPKHLSTAGPKQNPFCPWDPQLQVDYIGDHHVLLLNKYPVQIGHMLLITRNWASQSNWLTKNDWMAVENVNSDTTGLWFFNSGPEAGASQPHRHIQLLPRHLGNHICPREKWFVKPQNSINNSNDPLFTSTAIAPLNDSVKFDELYNSYRKLSIACGIGDPLITHTPKQQYNLLMTQNWMAMILRSKEGTHGFSVNALGFAGYLLSTEVSNRNWLIKSGPEALLRDVVFHCH